MTMRYKTPLFIFAVLIFFGFSVLFFSQVEKITCNLKSGRWYSPDYPSANVAQAQCVIPFSDAGKICQSRSDCKGNCLAEERAEVGTNNSGKCAEWPFKINKCEKSVIDGIVQTTICE